MPRWARLKTTSDADLRDRMINVVENGYGDEGPLAKGCCLFIMMIPIGVIALLIMGGLLWLGHSL